MKQVTFKLGFLSYALDRYFRIEIYVNVRRVLNDEIF